MSARACALILVLLAGATAAAAGERPVLLRVGINGEYPPFALIAKPPEPRVIDLTDPRVLTPARPAAPVGFDVDVAQRFAADTGRTLELIPFAWPEMTDRLEEEKLDLVMSGVTLRPERAFSGRFSRPYLVTGAVVVVRAEEADRVQRIDWLDAPNVRIAVNRGGYLEGLAERRFPTAQLTATSDNTRLPQMVLEGEVDAVVAERFEAQTWEKLGLHASQPFTHDLKIYMASPAQDGLVRILDDWLVQRENDGWMSKLRRKWFGDRAVISPADLCVEAVRARVQTRLDLMPVVAAAKLRSGQLIEDAGQEARVLNHARKLAKHHGLPPDSVALAFRQLIEAAKVVQLQVLQSPDSRPTRNVSLEAARRAVAAESDELIAELARCRRHLGRLASSGPILVAGVSPDLSSRILGALAAAATTTEP